MKNIKKALKKLNKNVGDRNQLDTITFEQFLEKVSKKPEMAIRNVFQVFNDMVEDYVDEGIDEYPDDPESINYLFYDCGRLFVEGSDNPFFADRLFANRLINRVASMKTGAQQNKIYIFKGPHGCGKSTFLNNLLRKFEEYANFEESACFETIWRLDRQLLDRSAEYTSSPLLERIFQMMGSSGHYNGSTSHEATDENVSAYETSHDEDLAAPYITDEYIEVPCPSHDHPVLMIPKEHRRSFFDDILTNNEFKWKLFTDKEYDWVFRNNSCTICSSLYEVLLNKLKKPQEVFRMIFAGPYRFNRRLGEGISVYNPGDKPMKEIMLRNPMLQKRINHLLKDSNQVKYLFSRYAKTNNGIYTLMDIKSHNVGRLIELHNIISEGVHKVEDIEENVESLFIALMNPEDEKNIEDFQSFADRIEYIYIPYVMDLNTEVQIYMNTFGKHIEEAFLPRILNNFARIIISSRLNTKSEALLEWIGKPEKYKKYCDKNLQLLKMEIYRGVIPEWLDREDTKNFTAKRRRKLIDESETEGDKGFSGRDSIKIFNDFYSTYVKEDRLINMSTLCIFFTKARKNLAKSIPDGFIDSLLNMYDYTVLQEVKESLFNYNEEQISREIQQYLFAVNFEVGTSEKCTFTGEKLEITEDFFEAIEKRIIGDKADKAKRVSLRKDTQKEYASNTLTKEIQVEEKPITKTKLYQSIHERYIYNLKEKVLDPFLENENFRRAIKDYNKEDFKTYDKKIRDDITFMTNNLCDNYDYTEQGAIEICMYVIDNDLAKKYKNT